MISHHLEYKFIAGPPCRIAVAASLPFQNGIFNSNFIQNGRKCFGDLLRTLIKTSGTTNPK